MTMEGVALLLEETRRFEEITRGKSGALIIISAYDGLTVDL